MSKSGGGAAPGIPFIILLLLMGVAFYLMCAATPLRWDDLMYQYVWLGERTPDLLQPIDFSNRVDNVREAFLSQCNHYMVMNGRFIVHFVTQCFCGFLGKPLFNILNALVYVFFLYLSVRIVRARSLTAAVFTVAALWFGLPGQWILSFDVVFPINYLWSATACLAFLLLLRNTISHSRRLSVSHSVILSILTFLIGNLHEGYTLPISGALFFYVLFNFKSIPRPAWFLIAGFWLGTATVVFAPGTMGRASGATPDTLQEFLVRKMDVIRYSKRLYLLAVALAGCWLLLGKAQLVRFLKDNAILLMAALFGYLFLFLLPYYSQRMGFPMDLFSVLLLVRLVLFSTEQGALAGRYPTLAACLTASGGAKSSSGSKAAIGLAPVVRCFPVLAACLMLALLLVHVPLTVNSAREVGREYTEMLDEYQQSPVGTTHFRNISVPSVCSSYVYRLGVPIEQSMISFTMQKEMVIE